ncbi:Uncharacterized protein Adt_03228 [Abeliophyllum distichum]|uniref:Uncharacterized protein n=1 Tax=Abeliophyllum distichum TaxID=126358 RepID=A0ABD1VXX2_9LAMI
MTMMNTTCSFVLNSEVYNTLLDFEGKLDQAEVKAKKFFYDLQAMGSTNNKLGLENETLQLRVEALASTEVDLKAKLVSALGNVRVAETKVAEALSHKRIAESTRKRTRERVVAV